MDRPEDPPAEVSSETPTLLDSPVTASGSARSARIMPKPLSKMAIRYFGEYVLLGEIARGGMGVVYRALQTSLDREVAIKMIDAGKLANESAVRRFQTEAEAMATLDHPNIVPIYEVGEHEGQHYIAMRFLSGGSLAEQAGGQSMEPKKAASLMQTLARAVQYAHDRGVLHRDLKPSNILLDDAGQPFVTDFGIAKLTDRNEGVTGSMDRMGTPEYMAPEQAAGNARHVTTAADIYSLGAILYHLLTGRPPFRGSTSFETLDWVSHRTPNSPRAINPDVDRDLETICLKCLEKSAAGRYESSEALADDLGRWLRHEPIVARPIGTWERGTKWVWRHPVKAGLMLALTVCVLLAAAWFVQWRQAERASRSHDAAQRRLVLKNAEDHFANQRMDLAIASLAAALQERPDHRAAAERLLNVLGQRILLVPAVVTKDVFPECGQSSPEGWQLLGKGTNTITILDGRSNQVAQIADAHARVIRSLRFSPDGQRVVSAAADSTAKVWEARSGHLLFTLKHDTGVNHAEFSPDGSLIVTASRDMTARLWKAEDGSRIEPPMRHVEPVNKARFSPNSDFILTASDDKTVVMWDVETTLRYAEPVRLGNFVLDARFATDGRHFIAVDSDGRTIGFVATTPFPWSNASTQETALALAPRLQLKDLARVRKKIAASLGGDAVLSVDLSPDGRYVAAGCRDFSARLWLAESLEPFTEPMRHEDKVNCVRFSPDGLRLVTTTSSGKVRLWDVQTGQPLTDPDTCPDVVAAGFSPDGNWMITSIGQKFEVPRFTGLVPKWFPSFVSNLVTIPSVDTGATNAAPSLQTDLAALRKLVGSNQSQLSNWLDRVLGDVPQ